MRWFGVCVTGRPPLGEGGHSRGVIRVALKCVDALPSPLSKHGFSGLTGYLFMPHQGPPNASSMAVPCGSLRRCCAELGATHHASDFQYVSHPPNQTRIQIVDA